MSTPNDDHIHYSDDDLFNPETHHEESDVNVKALIWFFVIFVVLGILTHFVLLFFYKGMSRIEKARGGETLTQLERPADADVPQGQPLLQPFPRQAGEGNEVVQPYRTTPVTDLRDMRRAEQQALETYGWVDQQKGVVRIPIDVAKKLVVQRGLPVQGQGGAQ
ncbi:MAG TPA: hypothetical protein VFT12_08290 [Thermoanaerobaculia bacterium]|nr:hypothetical protein [Thermoanaerobaculia bacterium]